MKLSVPCAAACAIVLAACVAPSYPVIDGEWLVTEFFADDVHLLSCNSEGVFRIEQAISAAPGESHPAAAFTGTLVNDNDCVGVDGPFTYVGEGALTQGTITRRPYALRFDADVNEAECRYVGLIRGDDGRATEIRGTLECTLVQAGVVFEFEGTWTALRQ